MANKVTSWLAPVIFLSDNWISLIGVVLVTTSAILWFLLLPITWGGGVQNPYLGILLYLILPGAFFLSLLLIPLGIFLKRRRMRTLGEFQRPVSIDLRRREFRHVLGFFAATTFANFVIGSQVTYSAVNYMDSVRFCGQTCHTVMQPEYTAYQNSPHARVECVACHIGPGASWFVRSKLSGVRQVFAVALHTYSTPIPTPVQNLRPARETCEACHWPAKFTGDRLRTITKYAEDEKNTESKTVLLMHIGGGAGQGIHGVHVGPGVTIRYASDESRQNIPWVSYQKGSAEPVTYAAEGFKPERLNTLATRVMDCVDCHNRPSHTFELPERAVDESMAAGEISAALPRVKKESVAVLKAGYSSREDAQRRLSSAFENFYRQMYPDLFKTRRAQIQRSAAAVLDIYNRNVFPAMKVTWGSYSNNLGHTDFTGCFRCHDDAHSSAQAQKITQDCNACHSLLAVDEQSPKVLTDLGYSSTDPPSDPPQAPGRN